MKLLKTIILIAATSVAVISCNDEPVKILRPSEDFTTKETFPNAEAGAYAVREINVSEPKNSFRETEVDSFCMFAAREGETDFVLYDGGEKHEGVIALPRFTKATDGKFVFICHDVTSGDFERLACDKPGFFAFRYKGDNQWFSYVKGGGGYIKLGKTTSFKSGTGFPITMPAVVDASYMAKYDFGSILKAFAYLGAKYRSRTMSEQEKSF